MRFLADESCDFAVVRALRAKGHDVVAVAEVSPRIEDREVIDRAFTEGRILLTEDKDFGQLVYAAARQNAGVVLLRYPARARSEIAQSVLQTVEKQGEKLKGRFTVLRPGVVRIRP